MRVRRPELVIVGAILLSTPMIPGILSGDIGSSSILLRFLGALLVCWAAGSLLTMVVDRYAEAARRAEVMAMFESAHAQGEGARAPYTERTRPDYQGGGHVDLEPPT